MTFVRYYLSYLLFPMIANIAIVVVAVLSQHTHHQRAEADLLLVLIGALLIGANVVAVKLFYERVLYDRTELCAKAARDITFEAVDATIDIAKHRLRTQRQRFADTLLWLIAAVLFREWWRAGKR